MPFLLLLRIQHSSESTRVPWIRHRGRRREGVQFANACQMLSPAVFPTARGTIDRPHCVLGTRIPTVIAVSPSAAADFLRNTLRFFTSVASGALRPRFTNFVYRTGSLHFHARNSKRKSFFTVMSLL